MFMVLSSPANGIMFDNGVQILQCNMVNVDSIDDHNVLSELNNEQTSNLKND